MRRYSGFLWNCPNTWPTFFSLWTDHMPGIVILFCSSLIRFLFLLFLVHLLGCALFDNFLWDESKWATIKWLETCKRLMKLWPPIRDERSMSSTKWQIAWNPNGVFLIKSAYISKEKERERKLVIFAVAIFTFIGFSGDLLGFKLSFFFYWLLKHKRKWNNDNDLKKGSFGTLFPLLRDKKQKSFFFSMPFCHNYSERELNSGDVK